MHFLHKGVTAIGQTLTSFAGASSCNQLELNAIKIAYAAALSAATGLTIQASQVNVHCTPAFRQSIQMFNLVMKVLAIGDTNRYMYAMQNLDLDQLNALLPGDLNDIASVGQPKIDTEGILLHKDI